MSDTELKGGHAPAERAGGRRITNKKVERRQSENERAPSESSGEEAIREVVERDTGLIQAMEKSYPTVAVRHSHEKPVPTHQYHHANRVEDVRAKNAVFQPRKSN